MQTYAIVYQLKCTFYILQGIVIDGDLEKENLNIEGDFPFIKS